MALHAIQPVLLSKHTIKPSTPTPDHLRTYKLSYLDHLSPTFHAPFVFFFRNTSSDPTTTILDLQTSLAKVLTRYYPFAGRIKDRSSIVCNDEGAEFHEARIACSLSDIHQSDLEKLRHFFPAPKSFDQKSLIVVQATKFDCGGIAVGLLFMIKLGDIRSMSTFMYDWASITVDPTKSVSPQFIGASILPLAKKLLLPTPGPGKDVSKLRRIVFDPSGIDALKSTTGSDSAEAVVVSLLSKSIATAFKKTGSRRFMPSWNMDLRTTARPPLPGDSIGSFSISNMITIEESEMNVQSIMGKFEAGREERFQKYGRRDSEESWTLDMHKSITKLVTKFIMKPFEVVNLNSLQGFPIKEVDFGWGKPVWFGVLAEKNNAFMQHLESGGIEVILALDAKVMACLESNEELLSFASFGSSVPFN